MAQIIWTVMGLINDHNDDYGNSNNDDGDNVTFIEFLLYTYYTNTIYLIFITSQYFQRIFFTTIFCKIL